MTKEVYFCIFEQNKISIEQGESFKNMANYPSAIRRIRRSKKSSERNIHYKSMMKTAIKSVLSAKDKESAEKVFTQTVSLLDKLASKGIIHKNKAANQKSQLALYVNKL
ncbi:MAG: 30S ribosomal protein S20 [bacterium]